MEDKTKDKGMTHTVYTALISKYEELKEPNVVTPTWKYICYTDQPIKSHTWEIRPIEVTMEPQRMARYIKINFHKFVETEYSLWLDASFRIDTNLDLFWNKYFKSPITAPAHPIRNCVYREVASCIHNKRGDAELIKRQGEAYREEKVPAFNGIITSGVLMRRKTDECVKLCEAWWEELSKWSNRDQIAFAKVSANLKIPTFRWDYTNNRELFYKTHYKFRH